ncbi:MAG TPA: CoA pyrophosphatase, partial [Lysobacter sp.]|nr:CoA pyrophosphatase [Lysobacter sp.]
MTAIVSAEGLRRALHPLDSPPPGEPYNRDELHGLLSDDFVPMQAAVLVGVVERDGVACVLLTLRTDGLRHHSGQVSFPGGRMEAGENALDAAKREAWEEIGLPASSVEPLGYLDPMLTITGFRVTPVVGWIAAAFVPQPDPNEVAEVFEVPFSDLLLPAHLERRELH